MPSKDRLACCKYDTASKEPQAFWLRTSWLSYGKMGIWTFPAFCSSDIWTLFKDMFMRGKKLWRYESISMLSRCITIAQMIHLYNSMGRTVYQLFKTIAWTVLVLFARSIYFSPYLLSLPSMDCSSLISIHDEFLIVLPNEIKFFVCRKKLESMWRTICGVPITPQWFIRRIDSPYL